MTVSRRSLLAPLAAAAGCALAAPRARPSAAEPPRKAAADPWVRPGVPHPGSDQIYWVPTFAQAQEVARHTGRLVLVVGSVGDWNGY